MKPRLILLGLLATLLLTLPSLAQEPAGPPAPQGDGITLFIKSAVEHPDNTATFPLRRGTKQGQDIWFIILDSSNGEDAARLGVNRAAKLANARRTTAVMKVAVVNGVIEFPATVDFTPVRQVTPGPTGFPPAVAVPGAVAEPGYSPLIQMPNGTIRNAPHLLNNSGKADKIVKLDMINREARYKETKGFQGGRPVRYVSTEASNPVAAALEDVTFAPALNAAPFPGGDGTNSARASLAAFVNGQTGALNPQRQGLNSALIDGLDPLNVLRRNPTQGRYSPLWDVHLAQWHPLLVSFRLNKRQEDFGQILNLVARGAITGPGGGPFGPSGFIVNCPIVSRR